MNGDDAGGRRRILITGASTGIGRHLAHHLSAAGHQVYAAARKKAHLEELATISGVTPVELDVRDAKQVADAAGLVARDGGELDGLVNNAGVGGIGPMSTFDDDAMHDIFDVNVFGVHRVTRTMLPFLLAAGGRIVNVGSQGGSITGKYFGPYTMTKHALEAFTQALDEEVRPHGVRASIVQPGGIVSAIGDNSMPESIERFRRAAPPFDTDARAFLEAIEASAGEDADAPESAEHRKPSAPDIVAVAVDDALFAPEPKLRYLVGTRWEGERVVTALIDKLLDANESPSQGASRDELVARLDRAWTERSG